MNVVEDFKDGLKQAFIDLGCELVDTKGSYESEVCKIKFNYDFKKLDETLSYWGLERTDDYFIIMVKDLTHHKLPDLIEAFAEITTEGEDDYGMTAYVPYETYPVAYIKETDYKDFAKAIIDEIKDVADNPLENLSEPDWTEISINNEQDRRECAEIARYEDR